MGPGDMGPGVPGVPSSHHEGIHRSIWGANAHGNGSTHEDTIFDLRKEILPKSKWQESMWFWNLNA